jgi:hypothetical protein
VENGMWPNEGIHTRSRIAAVIQRLIDDTLSESAPDPLGLREIIAKANILIVLLDMGGCFGIRPNGEVVSFAWDKENDLRVETCPRIRNIAFHQGSKRYSSLRDFIPTRPQDASDCPTCKGKGELPEPFSKYVCYCGLLRPAEQEANNESR